VAPTRTIVQRLLVHVSVATTTETNTANTANTANRNSGDDICQQQQSDIEFTEKRNL
jgi:hypothetical protein